MNRPKGIVAAGHALTAGVAESVLREGGNAFDAMVAALAAACVAEPVLASPGGGGFLLAYPAGDKARVYDFFVHTPTVRRPLHEIEFVPIEADFGETRQQFHIGRGTVATPGFVRGLFAVHGDLCRMRMRELLAPAVRLAREGVVVSEFQAYLFSVVQAIYRHGPAAFEVYRSRREDDALVLAGERLQQPELGDALEAIAIEGEDLFYRGEIAGMLLTDLRDAGQLREEDLRNYRVERRQPLAIDYRGARILTNPPPSSGGMLTAFALSLLAGEDPAAAGFGTAAHLDLLAQVMEVTAEARVEAIALGTAEDDAGEAERLLAPAFLARWRAELAGRPRALRGTTQVSIIDGAGNLASATLSNGEGSSYLVPGTGIVMNNMLGEDDLNPGGFQRWRTDSRMTSMMMPTAVLWPDGRCLATGSGGSNRIRSALLQVLSNLLDFDMQVDAAVHAPRMHLDAGLLSIEGGFDIERLAPLLQHWPRHHVWQRQNLFFGGAHSVLSGPRGQAGAGDPRRNGVCVHL